MELRQYLDILKRHRWFLIEAVVVVALVAGIVSALRTPVYEGAARVLLRPNDPAEQLDPANAARQGSNDPNRYVAAQKEIVESEAVAQAAAKSLRGMTVRQVQQHSSVHQRGASDVLEVNGRDVDPARARDIANAVARAYIENRRLSAVAGLEKATKDIEDRLVDLQARLADLDTKIAASPSGGSSLSRPVSGPTAPANPTPAPAGTGLQAGGQPTTRASLEAARYAAAVQYESLFAHQQDLLVEKNLKRGEAELIAVADTPRSPVSPKPVRDALLGAVVGLLLGAGISFLREQLDDRLRSTAEVERLTGLPVLAEVPYDDDVAKAPSHLAVLDRPQGPLAEAMRSLRTSIRFVGIDSPVRMMVVTSAGPGEGKSLVAANLAVVFAQAGYRTYLVSADLRRPRLDTFFPGANRSPGLTGVLAELSRNGSGEGAVEAHVRRALVAADVPHLAVLPAGEQPPNPAELLNSRRMGDVLDVIVAASDIVIVDTPPLLAVTDAAVLAARADGVVLVSALGEAQRDGVSRAQAVLEGSGARLVGVVVNKAEAKRSSYGAYYGYVETKSSRRSRRRDKRAAPAEEVLAPVLDPVRPNGKSARGAVVEAPIETSRHNRPFSDRGARR